MPGATEGQCQFLKVSSLGSGFGAAPQPNQSETENVFGEGISLCRRGKDSAHEPVMLIRRDTSFRQSLPRSRPGASQSDRFLFVRCTVLLLGLRRPSQSAEAQQQRTYRKHQERPQG